MRAEMGVEFRADTRATMHIPTSLREALEIRAERRHAVAVSGGTDLMVEMTFRHRRPTELIDLTRVPELQSWDRDGGTLRLGASVTFARLIQPPFDAWAPALAQAARTVGSPQIRNRATLGGNLATASPAGDSLPPLLVHEAQLELASRTAVRLVSLERFLVAPKRSLLADDELIVAVRLQLLDAAQTFMKIGTRNAMVISVASLALAVDPARSEVRVAYGSAGPVAGLVRAPLGSAGTLPDLVSAACSPIDDVRGTAAYRRHALRVLTTRALQRCLP
jgi:CO/xanthine dehydrogenase FAD-binding subunit